MYSFKSLKICFVGVGSIASKHISNLIKVCEEENISVTIDAVRRSENRNSSQAVNAAMKYVDNVYSYEDDIPDDYDIAFITNPTDYHMEVLNRFHNKAKHFFVEKPVISVPRIKEADIFAKRTDSIYYVACPMRYTDVLMYLKKNIDVDRVVAARSICSSYLPDWRPGTDYRKCYSAIKALGGGVSIDLIHEWDYLAWMFGFPKDVKCVFSRKSKLEIDTEDYASYIAEYDDKMIELHLDYYGRKSIREVMIFTDKDTIVGDFIGNKVSYLVAGKDVSFSSTGSEVGCRELRHFFDIVDGKSENDNDIEVAIRTLKLTQGVL